MNFRFVQRAAPLAFATFLTLCVAATPAFAADPAPTSSAVPEIGRVSTSDRHDEPVDRTTHPTYVVDRTQIEARGAKTIADAIGEVPGVDIYRYGAFGAQANVFMHGASSTSVLVLLDGTPVAPSSSGQIDIGQLSTVGVRRIEVVQGGGATLYGTSAVGGVINIITDVPRGTYLDLSAGSLSERDVRVGVGNGQLGASFERHLATNAYAYPATFDPANGPSPAITRSNADAEQSAARIAYDATFGAYTARVRLGSDAIRLGVPGDLRFGATPGVRLNTSRDDAQLEIAHAGAGSSTILTLSGHAQRFGYLDPAALQATTLDGRSQISLRHIISSDSSTLIAGVDLARESAVLTNVQLFDANFNPTGYATQGASQAQTAAYVQEQYATRSGVRLYGGVRAERDSPLGSVIAPSAGIKIPLGLARLSANAGTSFRVPTIVDRYYPGYSNPDLKPERSKDADITLASDAILGGASFGWFARDAVNLIELGATAPQNTSRASIRGFQATLRSRVSHGIAANFALTDTYRALGFTDGVAATRLVFTPVVTGTLGLEKLLGHSGFGFGAQAHVFGRHIEGGGPNNDGQTTVDAYVRGRLAPDAILALRIKNIGNERYTPILGYPAPGRTLRLELSTR